MSDLKNKNILLCVTGSIAAYKSCEIIRLLRKENAQVQVMISKAAEQFIGIATLAALSNNKVITNLFPDNPKGGLEHVELSFDIDLVLVAPATANILCKAANGVADDLISTTLSICEQPTIFVPAMNFRMWQSQATQKAVKTLQSDLVHIMNPEEGFLASLHKGEGRLPKLHDAMNELRRLLKIKTPLQGKKILISAGPTRERIDPVRFISNKSSGKMGFALAEQARNMGGEVTLISGPVNLDGPSEINTKFVETADEMFQSMNEHLDVDIIFMCAAVSDYTPINKSGVKIKSKSKNMSIEMTPTRDIIKSISKNTDAQIIAFALETCNGKDNATKKLQEKGAEFIILNHPTDDGCGIDSNYNKVTILNNSSEEFIIKKDRKDRVAKKILEFIISKQA